MTNTLPEDTRADRADRSNLNKLNVHVREPGVTSGPPDMAKPFFKIGNASGFPGVPEGPSDPDSGNLSPLAFQKFKKTMEDAAAAPDGASRDALVQRAAHGVAEDWARKNGKTSVTPEILHEARAQATFAAREFLPKLGLDPVSASAIGYSLERALEKEGFKTLANKAIDGLGAYTASSASTAHAGSMRAAMESNLNKLSEHGVTKDALKGMLNQHVGKLQVIAELAQHPAAFQRAYSIIAGSDKVADGLMKVATDSEFRHAIGNLALATGESGALIHKGATSAAILVGGALSDQSSDEMGRHAFRAAMSLAGGAFGGAVVGAGSFGFGAIAGGIAGSAGGAALADTILDAYDKQFGSTQSKGAGQDHKPSVSAEKLAESKEIIATRTKDAAGTEMPQGISDRLSNLDREHTYSRSKG